MSYAGEVLADSPRGYWKLNEISGAVAVDWSGNGLDGSYVAAPTLGQTGPTHDGNDLAVLFDGSTQNVSIPHNALLNLGDVFTCEAWVNPGRVTGGSMGIISKQGGCYYIRIQNAQSLELVRSNVADIVVETAIRTINTWVHLAATKNGATSRLYVNGVDLTGTPTDSTCVDNGLPLNIAKDQDTFGNDPFQGLIAHAAVYPTALTQARIQAHYNASFEGQHPVGAP